MQKMTAFESRAKGRTRPTMTGWLVVRYVPHNPAEDGELRVLGRWLGSNLHGPIELSLSGCSFVLVPESGFFA